MRMKAGVYVCLLASASLAQTGYLEGEVSARRFTDLSHLMVRLESSNHTPAGQVPVSVGGDFRFSRIEQGSYTLVVTDQSGNEITRAPVSVLATNPQLKVELPDDSSAAPGGPVSVSQLRHQPAPRAVRAAIKAQKLSQAGDYPGAAALLEKAVALDPQYADAHGNLGAQYLHMRQPERAAEEFRKAIALDPSSATQQSNLALALASLGQIAAAAEAARRALQLDSTNALGHYVLGCILAEHAATRADAIRHLELASRDLPAAATTLAELKR
jgi:Tfp pilus assembly protein PilF